MNKINSEKFWVVITAAGSGARFSQDLPKQYWKIAGFTLLEHSIECFIRQPWLAKIVVCLSQDDPYFSDLPYANHPKIITTTGAEVRWQTVLNALNAIKNEASSQDWILVHDGVRACLHEADLKQLVESLRHDEVGGILAASVKDTMKRTNKAGMITQTVDREQLWHALTPQMFRYQMLLNAIQRCAHEGINITDDASAIEHCGFAPKVINAQYPNPKLTFPSDLPYVTSLLQQKLTETV